MKIIIILTTILFLISSCDKTTEVKVEVAAISNHSGQGVKLYFYYKKVQGGSQPGPTNVYLPSNFENGVNYLNTEVENLSSLKACVYYTPQGYGVNEIDIPLKKKGITKLYVNVNPVYKVNYQFNNINCQGSDDSLIIDQIDNFIYLTKVGCGNSSFPGSSEGLDFGVYLGYCQSKVQDFTYRVVRNGISTEYQFNQVLNENEYNQIIINY